MLPTRLKVLDPSIPTIDPLTMPPTGAFTLLNNSLMLGLKNNNIGDVSCLGNPVLAYLQFPTSLQDAL